jgi:hypothetical protein
MPAEPVKYIGDKLTVGPLDLSFLPGCIPPIPGTTVLNGPVWIGAGGPPIPVANCMIGPGVGGAGAVSLQVLGVANFLAINNQQGLFNRLGLANVFGFSNKIGADIKAAFSGTAALSAKAAVQKTDGPYYAQAIETTPLAKAASWEGNYFSTTGANADFLAALAPLKPVGAPNFDIEHPTKKGWRLRYVCTEAPTADVCIKGTLKDNDIIELPDYWVGLVHAETIHAILTPIGEHQKLFYNLSECGTKIIVSTDSDKDIHCYYKVFAERKDASRNIIEYKGLTHYDYPGDNKDYVFNVINKTKQ